jgi:sterol desaturase/sphingolipid hydroxylase (fatty acid hydroxylase superfamily)
VDNESGARYTVLRVYQTELQYSISEGPVIMTAHVYETLAFLGSAGVFEILERVRPAREVDRWKQWKIDVLSFALAILMNRTCSYFGSNAANTYAPLWMLGGSRLLQELPSAARIFLTILVADFVIYWIHRAQHEFAPLWRTHAWHHSTEHLFWFSGFRTSFLHTFIYNIPQAAIPILVFDLSPLELGIGYSIAVLIQFWEHTNFDIGIGPMKYLLITPAYHRVHHSVAHNDRNLGTTFSLWDRMFGTYFNPADVPADAPLGLDEPYSATEMTRMLVGV